MSLCTPHGLYADSARTRVSPNRVRMDSEHAEQKPIILDLGLKSDSDNCRKTLHHWELNPWLSGDIRGYHVIHPRHLTIRPNGLPYCVHYLCNNHWLLILFCKIIHFMRLIKSVSLSLKIWCPILREDHCLDVTEEIENTTVLQC
jgi:hypothetical protein